MPNLAEHLWTGGRTMAIFLLHFLNTIINYKVYQGPQSCNHILYDFYIYKILLNYAHISLQRMKSADNDRCFEDIALCRYCTLQILKYSQTWNLQLCILRYRSADFWFQALQYASMYDFVLVLNTLNDNYILAERRKMLLGNSIPNYYYEYKAWQSDLD